MWQTSAQWRLSVMLMLTALFFVVEIVVGYITNSMSLIADSFHMFSDLFALIVAYVSVLMSPKKWSKNTFGWARAEVLGALVNAVFLCALCFSILVESIKRFLNPEDIHDPLLIFVVGTLGLIINLIGLALFKEGGHHHGHGHSHHHHHHHHHAKEIFSHDNDEHHRSNQELYRGGPDDVEMRQPSLGAVNRDNIDDKNTKLSSITNNSTGKVQQSIDMLVGGAGGGDVPTKQDSLNNCDGTDTSSYTHSGHSMNNKHKAFQSGDTNSLAHKHEKCHKDTHSSNQMNMRGVFLHVMTDALGSGIVIISAIVYYYTDNSFRQFVDPTLSVVMVCLIMYSTWPLLTESAMILLQTVPTHIKVDSLQRRLTEEIPGVLAVHEFHVWQLAGDRIIASAHIRCHNLQDYMRIAEQVKEFFHNEGIHSTTIQPEFVDLESGPVFESDYDNCVLDCPSTQRTSCAPQTCCGGQKHSDSSATSLIIPSSDNNYDNRPSA